jgi:iron complex transport system substrate-binding protein
MVWLVAERSSQTVKAGVVGRKPEPQEVVSPIKSPAPDVPLRQRGMQAPRAGVTGEPEQGYASDDRKSRLHQYVVEPVSLMSQRLAHIIGPSPIAERGCADEQRRPRTGPWTQRLGNASNCIRGADEKTKPQSGDSIEFSERPENQHGQIGTQTDRSDGRVHIGKGLVHDQPPAPVFQLRRYPGKRGVIGDPAIGIVGIDDHRMNRAVGKCIEIINCDDGVAGSEPSRFMLTIGRPNDRNRARHREIGHQLDQRLRSRGSGDVDMVGRAIGLARRACQRIHFGARWQAVPDTVRQWLRDWPRPGIDSRRQIQPAFGCAAMALNCLGEIAAMFHCRFMPSSALKCERVRTALAVSILVLIGLPVAPHASELPRIASINLCTDQLLVTLADPVQILGLSPYSRDRARSWDAAKAAQFPRLSGEAEDILVLRPDAVVAGRFTKRATRELLKEKGLRIVEFDAARSLDDVKKQIRQMGDLVQHPERAASEIERLDKAIAHAREVASRRRYRVLALSRRGWVSGGDSLTSSLLTTAGLANAAADLGYRLGGFASLEAIVSLNPDFLLVSDASDFAEDEGRAFMLHPALERLYPAEKRIVIPESLTVCGGPRVAEALDRLASELERVAR